MSVDLDQIARTLSSGCLANTAVSWTVIEAGGRPALRIDHSPHTPRITDRPLRGKPVVTLTDRGRLQVARDGVPLLGLEGDVVFIDLAIGCCIVPHARQAVAAALSGP